MAHNKKYEARRQEPDKSNQNLKSLMLVKNKFKMPKYFYKSLCS